MHLAGPPTPHLAVRMCKCQTLIMDGPSKRDAPLRGGRVKSVVSCCAGTGAVLRCARAGSGEAEKEFRVARRHTTSAARVKVGRVREGKKEGRSRFISQSRAVIFVLFCKQLQLSFSPQL